MNAIIRTTPPGSIVLRLYNSKISFHSYCAQLAHYVWEHWSIIFSSSVSTVTSAAIVGGIYSVLW